MDLLLTHAGEAVASQPHSTLQRPIVLISPPTTQLQIDLLLTHAVGEVAEWQQEIRTHNHPNLPGFTTAYPGQLDDSRLQVHKLDSWASRYPDGIQTNLGQTDRELDDNHDNQDILDISYIYLVYN